MRTSRWWRLLLSVVALVAATAGLATPAAVAGGGCTDGTRLFAVDRSTGHLDEVDACPSRATLGAPVDVDGGDWRGYSGLFAAQDGDGVLMFAVTAGGQLTWRRQPAAGAGFSEPVPLGEDVDWSAYTSLLVPQPGYIHAIATGAPVLTYQYAWVDGVLRLDPAPPLLGTYGGPSMMAARWGDYAEAVFKGHHYRIWRERYYPDAAPTDDNWFDSGQLPDKLASVVGTEPWLYAVSQTGALVLLSQPNPPPPRPGHPYVCYAYNPMPWQTTASVKGIGFQRVVVAIAGSFADAPDLRLATAGPDCPFPQPLEWQ